MSGTGGTAKAVELSDSVLGKGKAIEITYLNGNREVVALYPELPFVTFRSTFYNGGVEPLVLNHAPTISAGVDLGKPVSALKTLGTGGLLDPDLNLGSYAY